jgi:tRNA-dihydrouridine synthase B
MFDINKKIQIGNLKLDFPFFLAPMAGVTDYAFRVIAKEFGAGVVYSEFVSAHGIIRKNEKTLNMIKFSEFERPIGIQIFGDTPEVMENAAKLVYEKFKPDLIDINYGCPVPKVTKKGAGSAALKVLCLMEDITEAVVKAVDKIPVTVKMRAGWNSENIVSTQAGINLEKVGVKAITLHPRTTVQMYKGNANWDLIKELKENVSIPIIGNGDVKNIDDINEMFSHTNCDGIMIGRAALGNPWFFAEVRKYMLNENFEDISIEERLEICKKHLELLVQIHGEIVGANNMKKHFAWYFKGFKGASSFRKKFVLAKNYSEMKDILSNIRH